MILLFQNVPRYLRSPGTSWVYGRWGKHEDAPDPSRPFFFAVRGTLDATIDDVREVLERELTANPK